MPTPQVEDVDTDDASDSGGDDFGFDGAEDSTDDDFAIGTADLGIGDDNSIVAGFDGVEDESGGGGGGSSGGNSGGPSASATGDIPISDAIEDGLAEVACYGLEGRQRKTLRKEMRAIASQFKLGYFGERLVKKYLKKDLEDIPPEYGFAAAMVAFAAVALYKRPDGEERVSNAWAAVRDTVSGGPEPEPAPTPEPEEEQPAEQPTEDDDE